MNFKNILLFLILIIIFSSITIFRSAPERNESINCTLYNLNKNESAYRRYPLITNGRPGEADFLFIESNNIKARIGYACWGMEASYSDYFLVPQGRAVQLNIKLPHLNREDYADFKYGYYLIQSPDRYLDFASPYSAGYLNIKTNGEKVIFNKIVLWHLIREKYFTIGKNEILNQFIDNNINNGFKFTLENPQTNHYSTNFNNYRYKLVYIILFSLLLIIFHNKFKNKYSVNVIINNLKSNYITILAMLVCIFSYISFITFNSFNIFDSEWYSDYYDYLAQSLLKGNLYVPFGAIGGEAFIYKGHFYGYFGCFPAILRMPFILLNYHFGELTRISMITAYTITLIFGVKIFRFIKTNICKIEFKSKYIEFLMLINLGIGSTIFFLASRTIIYHEAIAWGVAMAFVSAYYTLIYFKNRNAKYFLIAIGSTIGALHSRPTTGIFALCMISLVTLTNYIELTYFKIRLKYNHRLLLYISLILLSFYSIFYISQTKFESYNISPFQYHIQYTKDRLAKFNNHSFSFDNLEHNIDVYLTGTYCTIDSNFPYFHQLPAYNYKKYPNAKIDSTETTISLPICMPFFMSLTFISILSLLIYKHSSKLTLILFISGLPMSLLLFTAIYISHRYTADFIPYIYLLGTLGCIQIIKFKKIVIFTYPLVTILTIFSIYINLAYSVNFQRAEMWGVPNIYRLEYIKFCNYINDYFHKY